jgi:predicted ester cyclase
VAAPTTQAPAGRAPASRESHIRRGKGDMGNDDRRRDIESFYRRYNRRCNDHEFDLLGEFVAERVEVNGRTQDLDGYIADLRAVVRAFPDYRWEIRHLLVDGDWVSAHFHDTGTHRGTYLGVPATGRVVSTQEFALYRVFNDRIVEVWVTADDLHLLNQLR